MNHHIYTKKKIFPNSAQKTTENIYIKDIKYVETFPHHRSAVVSWRVDPFFNEAVIPQPDRAEAYYVLNHVIKTHISLKMSELEGSCLKTHNIFKKTNKGHQQLFKLQWRKFKFSLVFPLGLSHQDASYLSTFLLDFKF